MQTPSPADTPTAHIEAMLLATGRFDGTTSALMARWTQAFYSTMAARTGTTPQALYERLPLKVVAEQPKSQLVGSKNKTETAAFKAWFGDSQAVGAEGRPMVLYHATFEDFEVFAKSTDLGYHFGTARAANDRLKHEGKKAKNRDRSARIIPAYLNIRRPAVLADQITWSAPSLAKALLQGGYITSEQAKPVLDGTVDQSGPDPAGAFHRHLVQALKANGYDGIKYRNLVEGTTRGLGDTPIESLIEVVPNEWFGKGSDAPFTARFKDTGYPVGGAKGDTPEATMELARKLLARRKNALDYSYIAFSPGQVKSAIGNDGSFSRESANLLHQAAHPDLAGTHKQPHQNSQAPRATGLPPSATNTLGLTSPLFQALWSVPATRAPAQAWRDILRGLVRRGLIKQEEVSWSGLDKWLDTLSKSGDGTRLSKSDMLRRLEATQVQVELSQPGFDVTPAMRAQALRGLPLFQSALHPRVSQGEPRGSLDPRTLEIALGPKADASTWIHETGHFFLEALSELASDADAPAQIVEDFDTVLDWFGVTREEWSRFTLDEKRPHHERWAQAVELYVMEERPPCEQLRPLMEVFAGWLRAVYSATSETLKAFAKPSPTSTKEFKAWFGGSKVVDENGEPLVVYRGQRRVAKPDKFVTTRSRKNPSFAADPAVASVYSRQLETRQYGAGSNVMPVCLSIKKPLDIRSLGEQVSLEDIVRRLNWDWLVSSGLGGHEKSLGYGDLADVLRGMDRLAERTGARFNIEASDENGFTINSFEDLANYIQQRGDKGDFESIDLAIMDTTFDAYMIGDSVDWTFLLSELGFDGIFHKDAFDVGARYYEGDKSKLEEGCEGGQTHDTYRPFEQTQVKSATGNDGSFDRDDPSILSQGPQAPCRLGLTDDIRRVMDRLLSVQACAQALPPEQEAADVPGKLDGQDERADPGEPGEPQEEQDDDAWRPRERMRA